MSKLTREESTKLQADEHESYSKARQFWLDKWSSQARSFLSEKDAASGSVSAEIPARLVTLAYTYLTSHGLINLGVQPPQEDELPREKLVSRLYEILRTADFQVMTEKKIRQQLEGEFGVDLTKQKTLVRKHVMHVVDNLEQRDSLQPLGDDADEVQACKPTAVVLGAGPAGLAAAALLKANGVSVTVLEVTEHVGGRLALGSITPGVGLHAGLVPLAQPPGPLQVLCRQQGHEVQPFSPCTGMQLYDTATPGVPVAAEVMAVAQRLLSSALSGIEQPGSSETEEAKRRRASGSVSGTSSLGAALEASLERLLAAEVEQAAATEIASSALAAAGPSGQLGPASSLAAGVLMSGDREKAHLMLPSSPTAAAAKAKAAPVLLLMDDDELADEKVGTKVQQKKRPRPEESDGAAAGAGAALAKKLAGGPTTSSTSHDAPSTTTASQAHAGPAADAPAAGEASVVHIGEVSKAVSDGIIKDDPVLAPAHQSAAAAGKDSIRGQDAGGGVPLSAVSVSAAGEAMVSGGGAGGAGGMVASLRSSQLDQTTSAVSSALVSAAADAEAQARSAQERARYRASEVKRVLQWLLALLELCAGGPLSAAPHDAEHLAALRALPQAAALLQPQAAAAARCDGTDTVGVLPCSVRALCEGLVSSAGLDVRYDGAKWVGYSNEGVKVTTHGAASISADVAVLAVPLSVLGEGELVLNPKLPDWKTDALSQAVPGSQVEVTLTFESAFWNTAPSASNEASEQAVQPLPAGTLLGACTGSEAGTRGLFNVFVVGSEPNILTALASGEAAEKALSMSEGELRARCLNVLRAIFSADRLPHQPPALHVARWGAGQAQPTHKGFAWGTHAQLGTGAGQSDAALLVAPVKRLCFAGEYTVQGSGSSSCSMLAAAVASGLREGARALKMLRGEASLEVDDEEPFSTTLAGMRSRVKFAMDKEPPAQGERSRGAKAAPAKAAKSLSSKAARSASPAEVHEEMEDEKPSKKHVKGKARKRSAQLDSEDEAGLSASGADDDEGLPAKKAGKEGKARSRKRRDEDDEEGRGGIEEPSAGEPAPRQRETREAARAPQTEYMSAAQQEAMHQLHKTLGRAALQASNGNFTLLKDQLSNCVSLDSRVLLLKTLLKAERKVVDALARDPAVLTQLAEWLTELLSIPHAEDAVRNVLLLLKSMALPPQGQGRGVLRKETLQVSGLHTLLSGRCATHRGRDVKALGQQVLELVESSALTVGSKARTGPSGATAGNVLHEVMAASAAAHASRSATLSGGQMGQRLTHGSGPTPTQHVSSAAAGSAHAKGPSSTSQGHAHDAEVAAKLAELEAAQRLAEQQADLIARQRKEVQHEAAAAPPPPEIKSFDEYSKQDKARPTGKLGAKGRIEHQRDEAPSSGGSISMDAMRTDVTNYIKQLIKAAIDKGRMPKTLYPLIKDKAVECVMTGMVGRTALLDDARKKKIRDIVDKYIAKNTGGEKSNGSHRH